MKKFICFLILIPFLLISCGPEFPRHIKYWVLDYWYDSFDERSKFPDYLALFSSDGKFSNSVTSNSKLSVSLSYKKYKLLDHIDENLEPKIFFFKYGNQLIKYPSNNYIRSVDCTVKNDGDKYFKIRMLQTKFNYFFISDRYGDGKKLNLTLNNPLNTLLKFSCSMEHGPTSGKWDISDGYYKFTLDFSGFEEVKELLKNYKTEKINKAD